MKSLLISLLLCTVAFALPYESGREWPDNTIVVDVNGTKGVPTIAAGIALATTGQTVLIYPGVYAEQGITISTAINIVAMGVVTWRGNATLCTFGIDGIIFEGLVKDKFKLECTHATDVVYDPNGKNYKMDGVTVSGNDILLAESGVIAVATNIKLYPTGVAGARVTGGTFYAESKFQIGEPVGIDQPDSIFGLKITGGLFHSRGIGNIYAGDTDGKTCDEAIYINGGEAVFYGPAIIVTRGTSRGGTESTGADSSYNAVQVVDGTFSCYGGTIGSNDSLKATVSYEAGADSSRLRYVYIFNNDTAAAIQTHSSMGDSSLYLLNCVIKSGDQEAGGAWNDGTASLYGSADDVVATSTIDETTQR